MGKVLIDVAGVDDEEILPVFKAVEICVVDRSARFVRDDAVLRLTHVQREHVARQDMLQKRDLILTGHIDAAHVGHVEDRAVLAAVQMLCNDSLRILDRHFPAAEIDHRGLCVQMCLIQYRPFEFAHNVLLNTHKKAERAS